MAEIEGVGDLDPREFTVSGITVHGDTPFEVPIISQIDENLWLGGCAADGFKLPAEIRHLVSLYHDHQFVTTGPLHSHLRVDLADSLDQDLSEIDAIAYWVRSCWKTAPTLVHCQMGLNRSGLVAARSLMLGGMSADAAISILRLKRSPAVLCNSAFENWLRSL